MALERESSVANLIANFTTNTRKTSKQKQTHGYFCARKSLLEDYWNRYANAREAVVDMEVTDANRTAREAVIKESRFTAIETAYCEAMGEINDSMAALIHQAGGNSSVVTANASTPAGHVRLPKIELPKFDGNLQKWLNFKDLFDTCIIKEASLSNVERLHYLKACLHGDAEHVLRNIPVTEHNFTIAWELLTQRYDCTRRLIKSHLRTITDLPKMTSESAIPIRNILDVTNETFRALTQLGRPTNHWDDWFVFHITEKLDSKTVKDWEISLDDTGTVPTYDDLKKFLQRRVQGLEAVAPPTKATTTTKSSGGANKPKAVGAVQTHQTNVSQCMCCDEKHVLSACQSFRKRNPTEKLSLVRSANICENCLRGPHALKSCTSKYSCKRCQAKHHTLLHESFEVSPNAVVINHNRLQPRRPTTETTKCLPTVLLATAIIEVQSPRGYTLNLRVLLDPGSQATFISEFAAQRLHLPRKRVSVPVTGIGSSSVGTSKALAEFTLRSLSEPDFTVSCAALILPRLGHRMPAAHIHLPAESEFSGLTLADPTFTEPGDIDVIIGADIHGSLLCSEVRQSAENKPVAQKTHLGWVVYGPIPANNFQHLRTTFCATTTLELNDLVQQMWTFNQHDDLVSSSTMTMDELYCEEYFERTTTRDDTGRFFVRYPFKPSANFSALTESKPDALKIFNFQQRRLQRDPNMQALYEQFMAEYISLGHMQQALGNNEPATFCYIPHHGVYKESSSTTKLRTVFNASRKYSSGVSLNDCLHPGPKLQNDLADLLLSWRLHRIAFIADIEKCFRQIRIHDEEADMQRIFWHDIDGKTQPFRLLTVTYGLSCSPYLTIKVLRTLAKEEEAYFPRAAKILREAFYMDDCLHGADSVSEALEIKGELQSLLQRGCFPLRKWNSNSIEFLQTIGAEVNTPIEVYCDLTLNREAKALGIYWACSSDTIGYKITLTSHTGAITKRQQLSDVAKTFDPLGLLAPVTVVGKIMFQELWTIGCAWDDPIPDPYQHKWIQFREELPVVENIHIHRWVYMSPQSFSCQLHIFADASQQAYAAVCYLRVVDQNDCITTSILMAKTKVAPLKKITVPCLELNAALLGATLAVKVIHALKIDNMDIHCWSDSKTALSWIRSNPGKHRQYIANRITKIQQITPVDTWKYVSTTCNPADVASRGILPSAIINYDKWWSGPSWLRLHERDWPPQPSIPCCQDAEPVSSLVTTTGTPLAATLLEKYSNINKLIAVTARCRRFLAAKLKLQHDTEPWCTAKERASALNFWSRYVQRFHFSDDIDCLRRGKTLPSKSKLRKLNPQLDTEGVLRMKGRLSHSFLPEAERFPVILPRDDHFTTLIIANAHECTLHGGTQTTLNFIRRRYWIVDGRASTKKYIRRCIKCFRQSARPAQQIMGDLPAARCTPSKPFTHCGIDYGGPFKVRKYKGRGHQSYKAYVALFVCFSTRAIHIELVSDMSTNTFLLALRRFFGTRGYCTDMYSDCATTFIGAHAVLKEDVKEYRKQLEAGARYGAIHGVTWHFIPPGSPNFGGIWEAGIKSMKHHLKRVLGESTLTFEEFYTVLKEVEAVLNSRPLAALSDDPDDLAAITPGHMLVGGPLLAPPTPSLLDTKTSHLNRWKLIQQMQQHFWRRWSSDYLKELQVRHKWQQTCTELKVGDLVLLRDERAPPTQWQLGRVLEVHPGDDNHVRVATIRTKTTTLKRAISKLVVLPVEHP